MRVKCGARSIAASRSDRHILKTDQGQHQYIDRVSGEVKVEALLADRAIRWLYSSAREYTPFLFRLTLNRRASLLLAWLRYDATLLASLFFRSGLARAVNRSECLTPITKHTRLRAIFERRIRYWEYRPLPKETQAVVARADARALIGSFRDQRLLPIKEKFFDLFELLGAAKPWCARFALGDWAILRLTPEKYHYAHAPVSGRVLDVYSIDGVFHSCNPGATLAVAAPYSKNRRSVTIIDTDVAGGTAVGLVAMIEVVALIIGEIVQCYSEHAYYDPRTLEPGMWMERGAVKSLFRPGSSTVVLLFEPRRIRFDTDLETYSQRQDVQSRFSRHFSVPLVETEVAVRSSLARPARAADDRTALCNYRSHDHGRLRE